MNPGWIIAVAITSALNLHNTPTSEAPRGQTRVVGIARLNGTVGFKSGSSMVGFDDVSIRTVLAEARARGCDTLMFDLDSPGGSVAVGERILDELQQAQAKGIRLIAWYGQAGSAASWIPFACELAVTRSSGICGGSVIWSVGPDGKPSAVDAKTASFTIARVKSAAAGAKRPGELVDAIFDQSKEVWVTTDGVVAAQRPADGAATCIDTATTVLNMDAATAVKIGFALGPADTRAAAAGATGIEAIKWIDLTEKVEIRQSKLRAKDKAARAAARTWYDLVIKLPARLDDAIQATFDVARYYEKGTPFYHTPPQGGHLARRRLSDHMVDLVRAADKMQFDESIQPENPAERQFREDWQGVHKKLVEDVKAIRYKLERDPTSGKAADAARDAQRLMGELNELVKSLPKPPLN